MHVCVGVCVCGRGRVCGCGGHVWVCAGVHVGGVCMCACVSGSVWAHKHVWVCWCARVCVCEGDLGAVACRGGRGLVWVCGSMHS